MNKNMSRVTSMAVVVLVLFIVAGALGVLSPSEALAQARPAYVRNVDEPDRNQYFQSPTVNCPFTNQCSAQFTAVPTGKRLHLTSLRAVLIGFSIADPNYKVFVVVRKNSLNGDPMAAFSFQPDSAWFYGTMVATNQPLDLYFEAGETPWVELGGPASGSVNFGNASPKVLSLTGHLVDVTP